jgi:hypothetical protein
MSQVVASVAIVDPLALKEDGLSENELRMNTQSKQLDSISNQQAQPRQQLRMIRLVPTPAANGESQHTVAEHQIAVKAGEQQPPDMHQPTARLAQTASKLQRADVEQRPAVSALMTRRPAADSLSDDEFKRDLDVLLRSVECSPTSIPSFNPVEASKQSVRYAEFAEEFDAELRELTAQLSKV